MTDSATGAPLAQAVVWVLNVTENANADRPIGHPVTTASQGDFYRLLTPGSYRLVVQAEGFEPVVSDVVRVANEPEQMATRVDVQMNPKATEEEEEEQ